MEQMMPAVYAAFKKHMISTTSYATKWYITLFANTVPFQMQLRLWDVFLLEGRDIFIVVSVAIVWVYRGAFLPFSSRRFGWGTHKRPQTTSHQSQPTSRASCLCFRPSSSRKMRTRYSPGWKRSSPTRSCGAACRAGDKNGNGSSPRARTAPRCYDLWHHPLVRSFVSFLLLRPSLLLLSLTLTLTHISSSIITGVSESSSPGCVLDSRASARSSSYIFLFVLATLDYRTFQLLSARSSSRCTICIKYIICMLSLE